MQKRQMFSAFVAEKEFISLSELGFFLVHGKETWMALSYTIIFAVFV